MVAEEFVFGQDFGGLSVIQGRPRQWMGRMTIRELRALPRPSYQSPVQPRRAERIASALDKTKFGVAYVSVDERGTLWLDDGQHRVEAGHLSGHDELEVDVQFTSGMSVQDRAKLYLGLNDRKAKPSGSLIQAMALAGDSVASLVFEIPEKYGFSIRLVRGGSRSASNGNEIACVNAVYDIVDRYGREHLESVISTLRAAYDGAQGSTQGEILKGISQFLLAYPEFQEAELATKLRAVVPMQLAAMIAQMRVAEKSTNQLVEGYAPGRGVLEVANRFRKNKMPDRFNEWHRDKSKKFVREAN